MVISSRRLVTTLGIVHLICRDIVEAALTAAFQRTLLVTANEGAAQQVVHVAVVDLSVLWMRQKLLILNHFK